MKHPAEVVYRQHTKLGQLQRKSSRLSAITANETTSGVDFWRNRGHVQHVAFGQLPNADGNRGGFVQKKRYIDQDGAVICDEEFRLGIHAGENTYLLSFDSIFTSTRPFYFGDQEEMGLGIYSRRLQPFVTILDRYSTVSRAPVVELRSSDVTTPFGGLMRFGAPSTRV